MQKKINKQREEKARSVPLPRDTGTQRSFSVAPLPETAGKQLALSFLGSLAPIYTRAGQLAGQLDPRVFEMSKTSMLVTPFHVKSTTPYGRLPAKEGWLRVGFISTAERTEKCSSHVHQKKIGGSEQLEIWIFGSFLPNLKLRDVHKREEKTAAATIVTKINLNSRTLVYGGLALHSCGSHA